MPAGAHHTLHCMQLKADEAAREPAATAAGKGTKISVPWEWGSLILISSTPDLSIASPLRSRRGPAARIAFLASVLLLSPSSSLSRPDQKIQSYLSLLLLPQLSVRVDFHTRSISHGQ